MNDSTDSLPHEREHRSYLKTSFFTEYQSNLFETAVLLLPGAFILHILSIFQRQPLKTVVPILALAVTACGLFLIFRLRRAVESSEDMARRLEKNEGLEFDEKASSFSHRMMDFVKTAHIVLLILGMLNVGVSITAPNERPARFGPAGSF